MAQNTKNKSNFLIIYKKGPRELQYICSSKSDLSKFPIISFFITAIFV